jgi:hypothetical protein
MKNAPGRIHRLFQPRSASLGIIQPPQPVKDGAAPAKQRADTRHASMLLTGKNGQKQPHASG